MRTHFGLWPLSPCFFLLYLFIFTFSHHYSGIYNYSPVDTLHLSRFTLPTELTCYKKATQGDNEASKWHNCSRWFSSPFRRFPLDAIHSHCVDVPNKHIFYRHCLLDIRSINSLPGMEYDLTHDLLSLNARPFTSLMTYQRHWGVLKPHNETMKHQIDIILVAGSLPPFGVSIYI